MSYNPPLPPKQPSNGYGGSSAAPTLPPLPTMGSWGTMPPLQGDATASPRSRGPPDVLGSGTRSASAPLALRDLPEKPLPMLGPADPSRSPAMSDVRSEASHGSQGARKRTNPLEDLIESEARYVEELGFVIRRVAAAWSRTNFPPPPLDRMFRRIEAVFKVNRAFGARLADIASNNSSPKALGDMLMGWIEDLEDPYSRYCAAYTTGFDVYPPVSANPHLPSILMNMSTACPPPEPLVSWTADALFLLPYQRLKYYKRLYARLLRNTKEGRPDHRLLVVANDRLDRLLAIVDARLHLDVSQEESAPPSAGPLAVGRVVSPTGPPEKPRIRDIIQPEPPPKPTKDRESTASSARGSSVDTHSNGIISPFTSRTDEGDRTSGASANTSFTPAASSQSSPNRPKSPAPPSRTITPIQRDAPPSVLDLEIRLDTARVIDLFTMQPKACRLQMAPSTLTFTRHQRYSTDVTAYFTPSCTRQEVVHRRAHIFVLSDLFLLCEHMGVTDKANKLQDILKRNPDRVGNGGALPEMWLCYPPLAGRHLQVISGGLEKQLIVSVMGRERFLIETESRESREELMEHIKQCIAFQPPTPSAAHSQSTPLPPPPHKPPLMAQPFNEKVVDLALNGPAQPPYAPSNATLVAAPPPRNASLRARASSNQIRQQYAGPGAAMPGLPMGPSSRAPSPSLPSVPPPDSAYGTMPGYGRVQPSASMRSMATARSLDAVPRSASAGVSGTFSARSPNGSDPPGASPTIYEESQNGHGFREQTIQRSRSAEPIRPVLRTNFAASGPRSAVPSQYLINTPEISPPSSPVEPETTRIDGPAAISAQMKCKVFAKQNHQQWKSLGAAKLKLYVQPGTNVKQLVVEADSNAKTMLISTIVLTDGVERVGKTGVAVELSDHGQRTGIIYMLQLRNEKSALGLFESLLVGSDRAVVAAGAR